MKDFKIENGVLKRYFGNDTHADIPEGVTEIGMHAFPSCESLTSIIIPASVTKIEARAFAYCYSLEEIRYAGSKVQWKAVKKDGDWNFAAAPKIVKCADGTEELPQFIIDGNVLKRYLSIDDSFDIPEGVTKIGKAAFRNCARLVSVNISDGVTEIGEEAFDACYSLSSVNISGSVTKIGEAAFYNCTSLESVSISDGVTEIGKDAFNTCFSLTSLSIPGSITKIGSEAFAGCSSLEEIHYAGTKGQWKAVKKDEDWNFDIASKIIKCADGIEELPQFRINGNVLERYLGRDVHVDIPADVTKIGENAFNGCEHEFNGCEPLTSVNIPEGVTEIGRCAFAFCTSLASVSIPVSVTKIVSEAFDHCYSLEEIRYAGTKAQWKAVKKDEPWNFAVASKIIKCADGTEELPQFIIDGNVLKRYLGRDDSFDIPEGVTEIGEYAFSECCSLTSVNIPDSVTEIGEGAFGRCGSLESITIPKSVTKIANAAFWGCRSLKSVEIPESVTEIGEDAFRWCESLESITIPISMVKIGKNALQRRTPALGIYYDGTEEQWHNIEMDAELKEMSFSDEEE